MTQVAEITPRYSPIPPPTHQNMLCCSNAQISPRLYALGRCDDLFHNSSTSALWLHNAPGHNAACHAARRHSRDLCGCGRQGAQRVIPWQQDISHRRPESATQRGGAREQRAAVGEGMLVPVQCSSQKKKNFGRAWQNIQFPHIVNRPRASHDCCCCFFEKYLERPGLLFSQKRSRNLKSFSVKKKNPVRCLFGRDLVRDQGAKHNCELSSPAAWLVFFWSFFGHRPKRF